MPTDTPLWQQRLNWFWQADDLERELAILSALWTDVPQPVPDTIMQALDLTTNLSVCNWNLVSQIEALFSLIGSGKQPDIPFGHRHSVTSARWDKVWTYYLALRTWQPNSWRSGYPSLLDRLDPDGMTKQRIFEMLGESTLLKELYVERLCLAMEWSGIGSLYPKHPDDTGYTPSAQGVAHSAAVQAIELEIMRLVPDNDILPWLAMDGEGQLEPCHHKLFRRYDILISSIGANAWRAMMPELRTDGFTRAEEIGAYIKTLQTWLLGDAAEDDQQAQLHRVLGEINVWKCFAGTYLHSVLTSFKQRAIYKAEERAATA